WSSYVNGLPGYGYPQVWAVAVRGMDVFAGLTTQGAAVFYPSTFYSSTINRDNWLNTGQSLPILGISSIYINDSSIFVGISQEGGIWRAPLSQVTGIDQPEVPVVPAVIQLKQNYPNPFNPTTTINYSIPMRSQVTLKVYNILGEKVATLVDAVQSAGDHSVNFNASRLASGVYLYQLIYGNYPTTRKMVVIK
ncbi:MAG: T9SS type A sorting domain-containing protein, partial [Candidatus Kryptoniota bacterium]